MPENMSSLDRIEVIRRLLDGLVEARGREKAGCITVIDDFLNHIQEDILIKEETIRDYQKQSNQDISKTTSKEQE